MEKYYLDESEYDEGVPSIVSYYEGEYPGVVDRYFTRFYHRKSSSTGENEDHLILYHSNKLCLVGLAKSHVALSKGISSINYDIGSCDRSQNQVKGKRKKGGLNLQPDTALAVIKCKDGSEYKIISGINGRLLEVNDRLEQDLSKLAIEGVGYVAVVLLKPENCEKVKASLLTAEQYALL